MYSKAFWRATFERAISTAAQATIGVVSIEGFDLAQLDWRAAAGLIAVPTVVSVLKSIVVGTTGTGPGVGDAEVLNR